jgi:DNA-binding helix-hairpin-helix protein with protein kinase domain
MDPFGELKKLHELHQCGAVSASEYDVMKSALLQRLLQPTAPPPPPLAPAPALPPTPTPAVEPPPAVRELNATNDPAMTTLGYLTCPFICVGTVFAIVNCGRGNVHGPIQLILNFAVWIVGAAVLATMHR